MEAGNFNNGGPVKVTPGNREWRLDGSFFPAMAPIPTDELSINTCIPTHFVAVDAVTLDGKAFTGDPLEVNAAWAVCRVEDAGCVYEIIGDAPEPVCWRLWRWANFIRFAGFHYQGEPKRFSTEELAAIHLSMTLRLVETP